MADENRGQVPEEDLNDADVVVEDAVQEEEQAQEPQEEARWSVPEHQNREPVEFNQGYGPVQPVAYDSGPQRYRPYEQWGRRDDSYRMDYGRSLAEALRRPGGINTTRRADIFGGGVYQPTNYDAQNVYGSNTGWQRQMARGNVFRSEIYGD